MEAVREFEEHEMASGHLSLVKEAVKYAQELNITLQLDSLNAVCVTTEGKVVTAARAGNLLKQSQKKQFLEIAKDKKWQGKLFRIRWGDKSCAKHNQLLCMVKRLGFMPYIYHRGHV